ncbi:MAG: hypothetical protein NTU73_10970, partial [Ignavibacteriae bacterium]|nr:hypothetical protein [Ignavibacteriota bacterium]
SSLHATNIVIPSCHQHCHPFMFLEGIALKAGYLPRACRYDKRNQGIHFTFRFYNNYYILFINATKFE